MSTMARKMWNFDMFIKRLPLTLYIARRPSLSAYNKPSTTVCGSDAGSCSSSAAVAEQNMME